mmetsp:Transcript_65089/g.209784  ORF Transcript_65089/g.209784 Transcript_65089/m.209784 type:complete len:231 (+) Transcript_65089:575-1267(+)
MPLPAPSPPPWLPRRPPWSTCGRSWKRGRARMPSASGACALQAQAKAGAGTPRRSCARKMRCTRAAASACWPCSCSSRRPRRRPRASPASCSGSRPRSGSATAPWRSCCARSAARTGLARAPGLGPSARSPRPGAAAGPRQKAVRAPLRHPPPTSRGCLGRTRRVACTLPWSCSRTCGRQQRWARPPRSGCASSSPSSSRATVSPWSCARSCWRPRKRAPARPSEGGTSR